MLKERGADPNFSNLRFQTRQQVDIKFKHILTRK
jgi:hypothetical protein